MKDKIVERLRRLNQEFYQSFSRSFSLTRQRVQPGVRKIINRFKNGEKWLDIGCGNGNLAVELLKSGWGGTYLGIDFSEELVQIAREKPSHHVSKSQTKIDFLAIDILYSDWIKNLPDLLWDGIVMLAVLHHIPGFQERRKILQSIRGILPTGSPLFLSVWQLQNSPRLLQRIQPWSEIGLDESQVETGDVLMDWRAQKSAGDEKPGYRYVHLFTEEELDQLATETGFHVMDRFYSDGKEGNLALYEEWE